MGLRLASMVAWASLAGGACGRAPTLAAPARTPNPNPSVVPLLEAGEPQTADGVVRLELACVEAPATGAGTDPCDGLDNDCDGRIDEEEGCMNAIGDVVVALVWNSDVDLDLRVLSPETTLAPRDHRGDGACGTGDGDPHLETAHLENVSRGMHRIEIRQASACDAPAGTATTASVTVAAFGTSVGTFNVRVAPGEPQPVLSLPIVPSSP